jgi:RNA polymerase sigma-70 factor (ECF subfamily)
LFGIPGNSAIAEVSPGKSADISVPLQPDLLFLQQQLGSGFFSSQDVTNTIFVGFMSRLRSAMPTGVANSQLKSELEELFQEHSHLLYCTAYSMLGNTADAEDVLQTVFLRLLRRGLPPDLRINTKGYLYRAAVNLSLNVIRTRKRLEFTDDQSRFDRVMEGHGSDPAEEMQRRLAEGIAALSPEDAQVLILRYIHHHTDAEIGKLLGVSRGTVAMRVFRSRRRLKKLMGEEK